MDLVHSIDAPVAALSVSQYDTKRDRVVALLLARKRETSLKAKAAMVPITAATHRVREDQTVLTPTDKDHEDSALENPERPVLDDAVEEQSLLERKGVRSSGGLESDKVTQRIQLYPDHLAQQCLRRQ